MNLFELEIPQSGKKMQLFDVSRLWQLVLGAAVIGVVSHFGRLVATQVDMWIRGVDLGQAEDDDEGEEKKDRNGGIAVIA